MPRRVFAALDLLAAFVVALGVFRGLPDRWWPVDTGAVVVVLLLAAAGVGLHLDAPWSRKVARAASVITLAVGLVLVTVLALTGSYLMGVYGPVGRGGAVILFFVAATTLPYLVVFPAAQLVWLRAPRA